MTWVLILIFGSAQSLPFAVVQQEFTSRERCEAARSVAVRASTAVVPVRAQGCFEK